MAAGCLPWRLADPFSAASYSVTETLPVTPDDIRAAAERLEGVTIVTPALRSRVLSDICGADIILKFENLQYTASFKERGAYNRLTALSNDERKRGVIAMSAGNHAQGVAYHARRLGIPATIVMPAATPFSKVNQTKAHKARIVLEGETVDEAAAVARGLRDENDLTFIHPYDDPLIVAGQGTIALEILAAHPEIDTIVAPIGGGGLLSGIAIAAKDVRPDIEIVGVEAANYPSMKNVLESGAAGFTGKGGSTIADGIAVKTPGTLTRKIVGALVSEILLVEEVEIERAIGLLLEIEKTVAEGAGAAALAGVLGNKERFAGRAIGVLISGGNIDPRILASILMRGLARDGRLASLRIEIGDVPGTLAKVTAIIGEAGGNIVDVVHQRLLHDVPVRTTQLDVVVETRDEGHVEEIIEAIRADRFEVRRLTSTNR